MANFAIFKSGQIPRYLESIHTPLYISDPDAIMNPDLTGVQAVRFLYKYWKRSGNNVLEMTASEKAVADAAEQAERDAALDNFDISYVTLVKALFQLGNQKWAVGQTETKAQFINRIKAIPV